MKLQTVIQTVIVGIPLCLLALHITVNLLEYLTR